MAIDLLAKFSVTNKIKVDDKDVVKLFAPLLVEGEEIKLAYTHLRDKVIFTDKKIIALDVQGLTGSKKEFRVFPYSKITSYSVETSGTFDGDSDFKIWLSGVGAFSIKFARSLNIHEIGSFLAQRII
ncbi:PH domain-containing protein [uncultured Draconibacterium sp.]|uniref:PH domain-containing protein n=1 Tax=uncultured Draconibacterium sp. TaxID=1573823 RepID=UPI0025ECF0A9|nr:PH domain-containing protein [uncultured Draconibacterium sp.]